MNDQQKKNWANTLKTAIVCKEPSLTRPEFKDECDINVIMRKYNKTGELPGLIKENPSYGDFSNAVDFHAACNLVKKAEEQFNALNSSIRKRFDNSPERFLEFATNPANAKEMVDLGLAIKKPLESQPGATSHKLEVSDEKEPKK